MPNPMPDPIPEAWLDAFADGWHSVPEGRPGDRRRAGLAAVLPLIEAETRERIARAIDDDRDQVTARLRTETEIDIADQLAGERIGLNRAARIARGDNTGHEQEPGK